MTQEDKELVIKDLCARLPYGVIVQVNDRLKGIYDRRLVQVFCDRLSCSVNVYNTLSECICIDSVKPYLRPMSSMTEEERREYNNLCDAVPTFHYEFGDIVEDIELYDNFASIDWLNKNMFDYRGLIPEGLAISTEEFNPYL